MLIRLLPGFKNKKHKEIKTIQYICECLFNRHSVHIHPILELKTCMMASNSVVYLEETPVEVRGEIRPLSEEKLI